MFADALKRQQNDEGDYSSMLVSEKLDDGTTQTEEAAVPTAERAQREAARRKVINRLKRLEGQVRGVQRMVAEERSCHEILTLISSVRRALDAAGNEVLASYLTDCRADIEDGSVDAAAVIDAVKLARG